MITSKGFWSYVHKDDIADGLRISRLARDVAQQFEMLTGDTIDLFFDKDRINWGDDWVSKIDESLASVAFFIAIVTPRYVASAQCRREFQIFAKRAEQLGIKELVLPILYVDVPELHNDSTRDEMALLFRTFQWEDWRELRFSGPTSERYRRAISRIANRLAEINAQLESYDSPNSLLSNENDVRDEDGDGTMGTLDNLARAESALPKWTDNLNAFAEQISEVGKIVAEANARNRSQSLSFGRKLAIAKGLAIALGEPSRRIKTLGDEIASQVYDVDAGFRAVIQTASEELRSGTSSKDDVCRFFLTIRHMQISAATAFENIRSMLDAMAKLESQSRDLRPSLRLMKQGLEMVMASQNVIDSWVNDIDATGILCR